MDTKPLRVLLTANLAVFLLVCVVFLVHLVGVGVSPGGLFPDGVALWLEDNRWLMWTSAALAAGSALALSVLGPGADR
jgi:hypothetical protein